MGIFEKEMVGLGDAGGGGSVVEAAKNSVSIPMEEKPEMSDDARKWAEGKLAEIIGGASLPEQENLLRILEASKENDTEALLELDRETFASLEKEWEDLRQALQSGLGASRENNKEKLKRLQRQMKALGTRIDSMRSEDAGESYANRARRYYIA